MNGISARDLRARKAIDLDLRKAIDTAGSGASGSNLLIPEVVSEGLRRFVEFASPIYDLLNRIDWPTNVYEFRSVTARATAAFTAEGAVQAVSNQTYAAPSVTMKYITTQGKVTGPMREIARKTGREMIDIWQEEIDGHADILVRELERNIINGDSGANALEFDGFATQITQNVDASAAALTLSMLDEMLDKPAKYPSLLITCKKKRREINALLQAQQRFVENVEVRAGFRVMSYNELPILAVDDEAGADLDDTILAPDLDYVVMPQLLAPTFEMLGKTDDTDSFFLKSYVTMAVEGAARYHSKLINLAV